MIKNIKNPYRPNINISVVVIKEGKLLLGKKKNAERSEIWTFPSGQLRQGENVEECALRELMKETGLKGLHLQLGPWTNDIAKEGEHCISLHVFVHSMGEIESKKGQIPAWEWFDWNALPSSLSPQVRSLILTMGINKLKELSCFSLSSIQHATYPLAVMNTHPLIVKLFSSQDNSNNNLF